jgi:hypothetical protein|tara:strand:+ start:1472 stop:1924 length:453 start_codon:yes stop_codon:yes gene_type:complete
MIECPQCTVNEQYVLEQLQTSAQVKDRTALAVIMGNIKQESHFKPNVCEGGAIIPYSHCRRGGYGLIQWTSKHRYDGLGVFASANNMDPSSLKAQTAYMIHEMRFRNDLYAFQIEYQQVPYYMNAAYYWLGWGVHGNRTNYTYSFLTKLQ